MSARALFNFCVFADVFSLSLALSPHTIYHAMSCAVVRRCEHEFKYLRMPVAARRPMCLPISLAHHSCMSLSVCMRALARAFFFSFHRIRLCFEHIFSLLVCLCLALTQCMRNMEARAGQRGRIVLWKSMPATECCVVKYYIFLERFGLLFRCFLNYTRRS